MHSTGSEASSPPVAITDLDLIGAGILIIAPDAPPPGQVLAVNDRARQLLDAAAISQGASLAQFLGPALSERVLDAARECRSQARTIELEHQLPGGAERRWLRLALAPLREAPPARVVVTLTDVTGRKLAETRTLASELKFEGLVEGSIQGVIVIREGRALFCNAACATILGFADAAGLYAVPDLSELVYPDDRDAVRAGYGEVIAGQRETKHGSFRAVRKDGAVIWLDVFPSKVLWEGEEALQLTFNDMTERIEAARALHESEERYRTLVEQAQIGIMVNRDGIPIFANDEAARFAGYVTATDYLDSVRNAGPLPLVSEEERPQLLELLRRVQDGDLKEFAQEGRLTRVDGQKLHYSARTQRIVWEGQPAALITLLDRSEHVRLDLELRRKEELLRAVFDALPVRVLVKDVQHRFLLANRSLYEDYGYTAEEFLSYSSHTAPWLSDEERVRTIASDDETMQGDRRVDGRGWRIMLPGARETFNDISKVPLHDETGRVMGLVTVAMDVTERVRAEEAMRASEERYRVLVESAQIGITVHVDGRGVFINRYLANLLGYERPEGYPEAAAQREPLAHIEAAERANSLQNMLRVQSGEQTDFVEQGTLVRNDGTLMHMHSISRRVLWSGRPAVLTAILDVTKRVQLEDGLRRSEERYRTLVDGSLEGIAVFGAEDFRARFVNDAMLRVVGADSAEEYIGNARLFDNIGEPHLKPLREQIGYLIAGGRESVRDELMVRRRDGSAYWAEFQARRVDWDGQPAVQLTVLDITDRKRAEEALKDREATLTRQNEYFRQDISRRRDRADKELVAESPAMRRVLREAELVARSRVPVLVEGETGSGKEVVAEFLHRHSDRADQMLSVVNCGALTENLMDAELFGYEKGAFTGATDARAGMIEIADRGTLFLDEIGDLPPNGQVRLLRFLEKGVIRRVGSTRERKVDVRILAATHKTLKAQVQAGTFREDLYHRLLVIRLEVPPLRERIEDILPLAQHFMETYCAEAHIALRSFSDETRLALTSYSWPGNVRELSHTVQRAVLAAQLDGTEVIATEHLDLAVRDTAESVMLPIKEVVRQAEHRHVMAALRYFNGNRKRAAESLGVSERHLYRLLG